MIAHPMLLFLYALANLTSALGFVFIAFGIMPRARIESFWVKTAALTCFLGEAVAHAVLALMVLFHEGTSVARVGSSSWGLSLHLLIAITLWVFIMGIYLQVGRLGYVPSREYDSPEEIVVATPASPEAQAAAVARHEARAPDPASE